MNQAEEAIAYRRLRAPRGDGQVLFDPSILESARWLRQNVQQRGQADCQLHGRLLSNLQLAARKALLRRARQFTSCYRSLPNCVLTSDAPLVLVGHQPELVHPGVWFKNFVLSEFAERTAAHAINLLVDNDTMRTAALRVPGGTVDDPVVSTVPLDQPSQPVPFEERRVLDQQLFSSGGRRVADHLKSLVNDPLIEQLWPLAIDAMRQHGNFGRAIAQARHAMEGQWGLSTLELPLSQVCDDWPFHWFTAHLLSESIRFREIHNRLLTEYRRVHKIRSHTHPVPDLAKEGDWVEIPFWLWNVENPTRHPAFIRQTREAIDLTDRRGIQITLPITSDSDAGHCVDQMQQFHQTGIRLRPRALITTMYSRLVLCDIFVHGIGGAKYDQLTDAIVQRFFGMEPLDYMVVSATLKLPLSRHSADEADEATLDQLQRDLEYHPEDYVDVTSETRSLIAEKRRWISTELPKGQRRERHRNIARVNAALQPFLAQHRRQLARERHLSRFRMRRQSILDSREYAFCLFPEESLRPRLLELSRQES